MKTLKRESNNQLCLALLQLRSSASGISFSIDRRPSLCGKAVFQESGKEKA